MSTGPILDHFWLFATGVAAAPVLGAAVVTAVVRRRAVRRGYAVEGPWWSLASVVFVLFLLMPVGGGGILGALRGIPPGLGFAGTLLFLLAVYAGPVALGAFAFGRLLAGRLSPPSADRGESVGVESVGGGPGEPESVGAGSMGVVAESRVWFVAVHLALFPAVFALAIAAA